MDLDVRRNFLRISGLIAALAASLCAAGALAQGYTPEQAIEQGRGYAAQRVIVPPLDRVRERRMAAEVTDALVVGDPVWLTVRAADGEQRFLALRAGSGASGVAVLLVHGIGTNPDHGATGVLRRELADRGHLSFSVQMPVMDWDATSEEYALRAFAEARARLAAAAAHLRHAHPRLALAVVSQGLGARMVNAWLAEGGMQARPRAWVTLGMWGQFHDEARLSLPVLDLLAERDVLQASAGAAARAAFAARRSGSAQRLLPGSDAEFNGAQDALVREVDAFLRAVMR